MLRIKKIGIDTYGENVAFLSRRCAIYRAEDFQALNKIEVFGGGKRILAALNIVDDPTILGPELLGLSAQAFRHLGLLEGDAVEIIQANQPESLDYVRAKINGETLSEPQLRAIIEDVAAHRYSRMEIAAFLIASASFMSAGEVLGLTRAMASTGESLTWNNGPIVDKHCIGGIPGNRTSMIVVPIVAAHGLPMPKTSSRAITSPAGTADTMEVLANVDVPVDAMRAQVESIKGCLVWGGHVNLSPADDVLISVERPLGVDTREQMVASILSKKLAAGSSHLLIDIPVGPTAKVRSHDEAIRLRKLFEYVAARVGLTIDVILTDGAQPVGRGIGPVLEARDVMQVLALDPDAPRDLRDRGLLLAGRMLEFDPDLRGGDGASRARELLESGAALDAMKRIIDAQGRVETPPPLGALTHEVTAPSDGVVSAIDCFRIARIARLAGAPTDKGAGIDLLKKAGDRVTAGEPLYRLHAHIEADFKFALNHASVDSGYTIGDFLAA
ncbi:MAG: thymidine phosphorylase family protein [Rhodospirillaceae bacterium]|nr:thymidine phosphorylase family protein [Rhodospirillaceae bacterium]